MFLTSKSSRPVDAEFLPGQPLDADLKIQLMKLMHSGSFPVTSSAIPHSFSNLEVEVNALSEPVQDLRKTPQLAFGTNLNWA